MAIKGRDTPTDLPRPELEGEEEETAATRNGKYLVQYRTCNWIITEAVPPGVAFYISEERHAQRSWKRREVVITP